MRQHFLRTFFPVCLLLTLLTAIPFPVQAAVVVLKSGDRITGLIVKMEYKRIEIDPSISDIIKKTSRAYGSFRTERTSITFLDLVRTMQTGQFSVLVQRAVLPFEGRASTLEPS